jgi:hypothetical protein
MRAVWRLQDLAVAWLPPLAPRICSSGALVPAPSRARRVSLHVHAKHRTARALPLPLLIIPARADMCVWCVAELHVALPGGGVLIILLALALALALAPGTGTGNMHQATSMLCVYTAMEVEVELEVV